MTFKKAIVWTDIHFGKKANSDIHNQDCLDFIDWMIEQGRQFGAETSIFCGDFFDVRNSINLKTLDYALKGLEKISNSFDQSYFIVGNHDAYNKTSLDINSLKFSKHIKKIKIIEEFTEIDNCTFIPWITDSTFEKLKTIKTKYVFGHLELPNFFMNSMNLLPDHGQANAEMFNGPDYVFSGHFHKRQVYKNSYGAEIIYIGNCFPHNYSDTNDTGRGCMLLENNGEPIFVDWADCPKYRLENLSDLLENPQDLLTNKTYVRVQTDIDLPYDEITFVRDTLQKQFDAREIIILPKKSDELLQDFTDKSTEFKSVDNIVLSHIDALDTESFDKSLLHSIYLSL